MMIKEDSLWSPQSCPPGPLAKEEGHVESLISAFNDWGSLPGPANKEVDEDR